MEENKETKEEIVPVENKVPDIRLNIVYGNNFEKPAEVSFGNLVDVGQLVTALDKVQLKDAYAVMVEHLNRRYREVLTGNNELKPKKTSVIKSKILRSNDISLGMDDQDIDETFGVTHDSMKEIAFIVLAGLGGSITTSLLISSNIGGFPLALSATTSIVGIISLFKFIGVTLCAQIMEDNSIEEYLQRLVCDYKEGFIDLEKFKSEMYRIVDLLSQRKDMLTLEGDENVKGR